MRVALLLLGVLLFLLLQAVEIWRRIRFPAFLTARQFWRRILTAGIFELLLLMWLVGDSLMRRQPPLTQLAYWSSTILLLLGGMLSAVREMGEVSRQYHRQRAELYRKSVTFADGGTPDSGPQNRAGAL